MRRLADGLFQLSGLPPSAVNIFLLGDVLVDCGTRHAARRVLRQLRGHPVSAIALTHAHPDHTGGCDAVRRALGVPLWCGEADADAVEAGSANYGADGIVPRALARAWRGRSAPVARRLREGDEVGGFTVLETPGHSPGHLSFWRESDRTLLAGEVLNNLNNWIPGRVFMPQEPASFSTHDRARNRASVRRLAALEPALVCFCHGPPLRDTSRFAEFVASLPS